MTLTIANSTTQQSSSDATKLKQLKGAAQQFEAVFMRQMIKSMRSASLGDGILDNDASKQFQEMSDSKLADGMSEKGTLGIADMLVKQFAKQVAPNASAATVNAATTASTAASIASSATSGAATP